MGNTLTISETDARFNDTNLAQTIREIILNRNDYLSGKTIKLNIAKACAINAVKPDPQYNDIVSLPLPYYDPNINTQSTNGTSGTSGTQGTSTSSTSTSSTSGTSGTQGTSTSSTSGTGGTGGTPGNSISASSTSPISSGSVVSGGSGLPIDILTPTQYLATNIKGNREEYCDKDNSKAGINVSLNRGSETNKVRSKADFFMLNYCAKSFYERGCVKMVNQIRQEKQYDDDGNEKLDPITKKPIIKEVSYYVPEITSAKDAPLCWTKTGDLNYGPPECSCLNSFVGPNLNTWPSSKTIPDFPNKTNPYGLTDNSFFADSNTWTKYSLNVFKVDQAQQFPTDIDNTCAQRLIGSIESGKAPAYLLDEYNKDKKVCVNSFKIADSKITKLSVGNITQSCFGITNTSEGGESSVNGSVDLARDYLTKAANETELANIRADIKSKKEATDKEIENTQKQIEKMKEDLAKMTTLYNQNKTDNTTQDNTLETIKTDNEKKNKQLQDQIDAMNKLIKQLQDANTTRSSVEESARQLAETSNEKALKAEADKLKAELNAEKAKAEAAVEKTKADKAIADAKAENDKLIADAKIAEAKAAAEKAFNEAKIAEDARKLADEKAKLEADKSKQYNDLLEQIKNDKSNNEKIIEDAKKATEKASLDAKALADKTAADAKALADKTAADTKAIIDKILADNKALADKLNNDTANSQKQIIKYMAIAIGILFLFFILYLIFKPSSDVSQAIVSQTVVPQTNVSPTI